MKKFKLSNLNLAKTLILAILLTPTFFANASSDNAKVICSSPHAILNQQGIKTNVIGLVSMDELMPDCTQHVVQAPVESLGHSESGITVQSLKIKWHQSDTAVSTNIGENAVFNIDDIRNASHFIQVGKNYLIHFQTCEGVSPSLISMYAVNTPSKGNRKSKLKSLNKLL